MELLCDSLRRQFALVETFFVRGKEFVLIVVVVVACLTWFVRGKVWDIPLNSDFNLQTDRGRCDKKYNFNVTLGPPFVFKSFTRKNVLTFTNTVCFLFYSLRTSIQCFFWTFTHLFESCLKWAYFWALFDPLRKLHWNLIRTPSLETGML